MDHMDCTWVLEGASLTAPKAGTIVYVFIVVTLGPWLWSKAGTNLDDSLEIAATQLSKIKDFCVQ